MNDLRSEVDVNNLMEAVGVRYGEAKQADTLECVSGCIASGKVGADLRRRMNSKRYRVGNRVG